MNKYLVTEVYILNGKFIYPTYKYNGNYEKLHQVLDHKKERLNMLDYYVYPIRTTANDN